MEIADIPQGESWACRFRIQTFLTPEGLPMHTQLQPGQAHPGHPGIYQGLGVIEIRDSQNRRLRVWDTALSRSFTVSWDDCWDVDRVEWQ